MDVEDLYPAGDLPRAHVQQPGGLGLHPAGLLQHGYGALIQIEIIELVTRLSFKVVAIELWPVWASGMHDWTPFECLRWRR